MTSTDTQADDLQQQIVRIARRERGRLVASLVARLGGAELALAEDVAQDALLAAMSTWTYQGMPDNPAAWLARVAHNRAIDRLRRSNRESPYAEESDTRSSNDVIGFSSEIEDPELKLIFLCCHARLRELDQLVLTLKVVSGFTVREIAGVLLDSETAIGQRLARAKRKLREVPEDVDAPPTRFDIQARLDTALKTIYLMFSVGYAPRSGDTVVRRDIAEEALRLSVCLAEQPGAGTPNAQALAALLNLQASRLGAREGDDGSLIVLSKQDRSRWDRERIARGLGYLKAAQQADTLSRYHLEAGIAAAHATAASWKECDWNSISRCYELLLDLVYSPVIVVNACVAQAMRGEPDLALETLDLLAGEKSLKRYAPYFVARAEVLRMLGREGDAAEAFSAALDCGGSKPVLKHLEQRLAACV